MSASLLTDDTLNARETLKVVVVYDDKASRDHVLRIRDHLSEHFGGDLELVCSWWRFEFLTDENLSGLAAQDAEKSEVLLFAVHSTKQLPAAIEQWVDRCCSRSRTGPVLVALLPTEDSELDLSAIDTFLGTVAARAGLDYLGASASAAVPSELARRSIAYRADTRTMVMDGILNIHGSPRPRWGINE